MRHQVFALVILASITNSFLTPSATAQIQPGGYLVSLSNTTSTFHELWTVDSATRKATQLTMAPSVKVNCITMLTPSNGWIGTVDDPATVYSMSLSGTTATMTSLFKTATALAGKTNIAQIARVGGLLYFSTNPGATIYSIPVGVGVDPTLVIDLATVTGFPTGGLANAICSDGATKLWVGIWSGGEIFEVDVSSTTPTAKLLTKLPDSKLPTTGTSFPVHMHYRAGRIESIGLYGDVVVIDPATLKVDGHYFAASPTGTGFVNTKNCGVFNPDSGDYATASRDGSLDHVVPVGAGQIARFDVTGIGGGAMPSNNSTTGIYYNPAGAKYSAYDNGCVGQAGFGPTSVGRGAATKGNASFGFGLDTCPAGQNIAILLIGASTVKADLGGLGLSGCNLPTVPLLALPVLTSNATANGFGSATVPVPLPNSSLTLHTQWILFNATTSTFLAVSDGRTLTL